MSDGRAFRLAVSGLVAGPGEAETSGGADRLAGALSDLMAGSRDAVFIAGPGGDLLYLNSRAESLLGAKSDAQGGVPSFIPPELAREAGSLFSRLAGGGEVPPMELVLETPGGSVAAELSASLLSDGERPVGLVGVLRDVTERRRSEAALAEREEGLRRHRERLEELVRERTARLRLSNENLRVEVSERKRVEGALRESEKFLSSIFESIRDPFCIIDRGYTIVMANEEYATIKGRSVRELAGRTCFDVLHGRAEACPDCVVQKTLLSGDPCAKDKLERLPDGSEAWLEIYTYPIFAEGASGEVAHVIEYIRDITGHKKAEMERKRLIDSLGYLSTTDSLTAVLNRRALVERLECEISRARRYYSPLSVILLDIDGFKEVNDTQGHAVGDRVLTVVSDTLKGSLRKTDVLGRYGGDEFMVVLPATALEGAEGFAERIRRSVETARLALPGASPFKVTLSLGVTVFGEQDGDADSLIRRADRALYASKHSGRNRVSVLTR